MILELLVIIFVTTRGELSENKIHTEEEEARKWKETRFWAPARYPLGLSMT